MGKTVRSNLYSPVELVSWAPGVLQLNIIPSERSKIEIFGFMVFSFNSIFRIRLMKNRTAIQHICLYGSYKTVSPILFEVLFSRKAIV